MCDRVFWPREGAMRCISPPVYSRKETRIAATEAIIGRLLQAPLPIAFPGTMSRTFRDPPASWSADRSRATAGICADPRRCREHLLPAEAENPKQPDTP